MRLTLKPFGPVDRGVLEHLRHEIRFFDEVVVAPEGPIPLQAYDPKRGKYRASVLRAACDAEAGDRVLGITEVDLFEPGLNFVFGHADLPGRHAVISLARLRQGGRDLLLERAVKEAVHEIGHTLGLTHHESDPRCVMHFSNTLADTDRKGRDFCPSCARAAAVTLRRLRT